MSEAEPDDDDEETDSERAEVRRWEKLIEAWLRGATPSGDQGEKIIAAWLSGAVPIGDREARELERRLGLPAGWLDRDHLN